MAEQQTKKQKTSHNFFRTNKKRYLEVGQKGFLATCNFREKDCVRECYNILNQYADELYGPMNKLSQDDCEEALHAAEELDIADDLQKQIDATKTTSKSPESYRFQMVNTGAVNCVFIKTTLDDPLELGIKIISDIALTKQQKSRYLLRLVPVEAVCKANLPDILNAGGKLFDKHFLKEGHTFSIIFNKRYNNVIKRDDVIHELANVVSQKNIHNKVDLRNPELSVIVEVIKGMCCLSVVESYLKYKKYNIVELANPTKDDEKGTVGEVDSVTEVVNEKDSSSIDAKAKDE